MEFTSSVDEWLPWLGRVRFLIITVLVTVVVAVRQLTPIPLPVRTLLLPLGIDVRLFRPGYESEATEWRQRLSIPTGAKVLLSARILAPLSVIASRRPTSL